MMNPCAVEGNKLLLSSFLDKQKITSIMYCMEGKFGSILILQFANSQWI